jgi:peptidoglycan/LPS O-acetylase OafA/YrhL
VYATLAVAATAPLAVGSWWLIEKRALSLKRLDIRKERHRKAIIAEPLAAPEVNPSVH